MYVCMCVGSPIQKGFVHTYIHMYAYSDLFYRYRRVLHKAFREGALQSPQKLHVAPSERGFSKAPIQKGLCKAPLERGPGKAPVGFTKSLQTGALQSSYTEATLYTHMHILAFFLTDTGVLHEVPVKRALQSPYR